MCVFITPVCLKSLSLSFLACGEFILIMRQKITPFYGHLIILTPAIEYICFDKNLFSPSSVENQFEFSQHLQILTFFCQKLEFSQYLQTLQSFSGPFSSRIQIFLPLSNIEISCSFSNPFLSPSHLSLVCQNCNFEKKCVFRAFLSFSDPTLFVSECFLSRLNWLRHTQKKINFLI